MRLPGPARGPRLRRTVAALLVAAGWVTLAAPAAVPAGAAPVVDPAVVTVDALSPVYATTGQTLTLTGRVLNAGTEPLTGVQLLIGVGAPPAGRGALVHAFGEQAHISQVLPSHCTGCLPATLQPGSGAAWAVTVPLGTRLDRAAVTVYPLVVRAVSSAGTLGQATTWLPYFPGGVAAPVRVSWVWPLDPAPVLDASGAVADPSFPASLGSTGAVGALLADATAPPGTVATDGQPGFAPVTYAVEPSLLAAAATTAQDGWRRSGDPTTHAADATSAAFLAALRAATSDRAVLALPYADPDGAALTHAGLTLDLTTAVAVGRSDVAAALPRADVLAGAGWVPGDAIDPAMLDAYAGAGDTTLLMGGTQLPPPADAFPGTQTAVTTLPTRGPTVTALLTDPDLEAQLAAGGRDGPTPLMAAQRLMALLASIVGEAPNRTGPVRDVVLALPRGVTPESAWAADVLQDTGSVPWLRAVPLQEMTDDPPAARAPMRPYPSSARAAELPAATLVGRTGSVAAVRATVNDLGSMLTMPTLVRPLDEALSAAESYAWRADPAGSSRLRSGVAGIADGLLGEVRVATAATVTLASGRASIPVTVANGIAEPVTVQLHLRATDRTKIGSVTQSVTVGADRKLRVVLPATSRRAGTFRVTISLATPSGRQLTAVPVTVHSRAYGRVTLGITFGALAVLFVALAVRLARRLARRRAG